MNRHLPPGFKVKYQHVRLRDEDGAVTPRGGETIATVLDTEGKFAAEGRAVCSPHDGFNRQIGRTVSLQRAIAKMAGVTEEREQRDITSRNNF